MNREYPVCPPFYVMLHYIFKTACTESVYAVLEPRQDRLKCNRPIPNLRPTLTLLQAQPAFRTFAARAKNLEMIELTVCWTNPPFPARKQWGRQLVADLRHALSSFRGFDRFCPIFPPCSGCHNRTFPSKRDLMDGSVAPVDLKHKIGRIHRGSFQQFCFTQVWY